MFDAKNLLDALMRDAHAGGVPRGQAAGGLGDIFGQLMSGSGGLQAGLGEVLNKMVRGGPKGAGGQGGFGDLFGQLQQMAASSGTSGKPGQGQGGSIIDVLGQVLGQATQGVREGAAKADQATGASDKLREVVQQMTGQSPEVLMAKLQELIKNNQLGAGAALGGLGALVLGTRAGRSLAGSAVRLGALALIGGLAYKAYQNYSQGKPILSGDDARVDAAAPAGSGFEPQAISNETATLYIRTMIAAAAADGRIDETEKQRILGSLGQAGVEPAAAEFLAREMASPASVEELAASVKTPEEAVQVYTAARLAIDVDAQEESAFLAALATALGLEPGLVDNIDQAATGAEA
jgi:uncharacterized membrane protein YebE (DUF533 family)